MWYLIVSIPDLCNLTYFVKNAASVFKKPIGHIMNLSIEKNVVPKDLKNARVVPLFKKIRKARCCLLYQKSWKGLFIHNWKKKLLFDFQSGMSN